VKDEVEWWNVNVPEVKETGLDDVYQNDRISYFEPPIKLSDAEINELLENEKVERLYEIRASLVIFFLAMLLPWYHPGNVSGFHELINTWSNISWFIDFNFNIEPNYFDPISQIGWLLYIISPLIFTINFIVMYYYYHHRELDIGEICYNVHFCLMAIIIGIEYLNWGLYPPLDYSLGFNIILISGLCFNPNQFIKLFLKSTKTFFDSYGGLPKN
tara:strand:+ start:1102 stop:1746 length:645 start_codon:yes stop_codon:yes gene_type:complete